MKYENVCSYNFFVIVVVTILPITLYLVVGELITLLKLFGEIEARHIPAATGLLCV